MLYIVTVTDDQSMGMHNREIVVDATTEMHAHRIASGQLESDEFIRGIVEAEEDPDAHLGPAVRPMGTYGAGSA